MLKVAPVVRPRWLLSVLSRWAAQLQVLQLTLARAPGDSQALYGILLSTLLCCFADEISIDPFRASTAVLRRTGPSTCDVYRRTGVHFTPAWTIKNQEAVPIGMVIALAPGKRCLAGFVQPRPGWLSSRKHTDAPTPALWLRLLVSMRTVYLRRVIVHPALLEGSKTFSAAVGLSVLLYDVLLTFGDEVRYIWRRPITTIKVLYLFLRYGVTIAQIFYFQDLLTCFDSDKRLGSIKHVTQFDPDSPSCRTSSRSVAFEVPDTLPSCVGSLIVLALVGSMSLVLANYIMIIRVYTLWDHRKWMLRTLFIGYALSQPASYSLPAIFDVFLFVLTITNAASRPRRANVKIITDLRRDGLVFYLGLFVGRFLNVALSIPTDIRPLIIHGHGNEVGLASGAPIGDAGKWPRPANPAGLGWGLGAAFGSVAPLVFDRFAGVSIELANKLSSQRR
ncbi:hypothetical protein EDB86DRAFT_2828801 [Lactarius hatsudake]|nr:hypothetical protein EDB86DRAFT_2828801 [Lactarius hatsudake]